jgi:hypothetical protein
MPSARSYSMRRILPLSLIFLTFLGGLAIADRDRRGDRRDRRDDRSDRRDNRRDDRRDRGWDRRERRVERHDHRRVYRGPIRSNRRVIQRRPVHWNAGVYVFADGRRYRHNRPVIRQRYYNVRMRPQVIVERVPVQSGYIWVNGSWSWGGGEWVWNSGHYAPDPSIQIYYDDHSWE